MIQSTSIPKLFEKRNLIFLTLIVILTFFAFLPALANDFVNWDDPAYIENDLITKLSYPNIKAIFTSFVNGNYTPLTILSFAIEYHFVELDAYTYHLDNIILHIMNTVLVYVFIMLLTKSPVAALIGSLLFGIHPMRVESVAWITERKDVLFAFFYLLGLIVYLMHAASRHRKRYFIVSMIFFTCSLLSKQAAVSFPLILIIIDVYLKRPINKALILEKAIPLSLSLLCGIITIYGTYTPLIDVYPMSKAFSMGIPLFDWDYSDPTPAQNRIALILFVLFMYVMKVFWVTDLCAYYPPYDISADHAPVYIYMGAFIFVIISLCVLIRYFRKKSILFGGAFFLLAIGFNLPLKEFGHAAHIADRFTYVPYIGLFLIIGQTINDISQHSKRLRPYLFVGIGIISLFLAFQTATLCKVWKNSQTLWNDVIAKYPNCALAYFSRGRDWQKQKNYNKAINDYSMAITFDPKYYKAYNNRGSILGLFGESDLELSDYLHAIEVEPSYKKRYIRLYVKRIEEDRRLNRPERIKGHCQRLLAIEPNLTKLDEYYDYCG